MAVTAAAPKPFNEADVRRQPKGGKDGGQFTDKARAGPAPAKLSLGTDRGIPEHAARGYRFMDLASVTGFPIYFWGPPGVGKSESVERWAKKRGYHFRQLVLSQVAPETLGLLPREEHAVTTDQRIQQAVDKWGPVKDEEWLEQRSRVRPIMTELSGVSLLEEILHHSRGQGQRTVLFLDEFNNGNEAVMSQVKTLLTERKIGDSVLPDDTIIIAASNPVEDVHTANTLDTALRSRFMHLWWDDYMLADEEEIEEAVQRGWPVPELGDVDWEAASPSSSAYAMVSAVVGTYHAETPSADLYAYVTRRDRNKTSVRSQVNTNNEGDDPDQAYATNRSWQRLKEQLAGAYQFGDTRMRYDVCVGMLGQTRGMKFARYMDSYQSLISPKEWIEQGKSRAGAPVMTRVNSRGQTVAVSREDEVFAQYDALTKYVTRKALNRNPKRRLTPSELLSAIRLVSDFDRIMPNAKSGAISGVIVRFSEAITDPTNQHMKKLLRQVKVKQALTAMSHKYDHVSNIMENVYGVNAGPSR